MSDENYSPPVNLFPEHTGDEWLRISGAENAAPAFPDLAFLGPLDVPSIRPVDFVYGRFFARGYTSLTVAAPKVGKSMLAVSESVDMACGGRVFGRRFDPLRVLYYNAEDDIDTLKARVAAVCQYYAIDPGDLADTLAIESGIDWPDFYLLDEQSGGVLVNEPAFQHLEARIVSRDFDVAQFDPLQDMSRAGESNEAFRALGQRVRRLASETETAIGLTHHTRKIAPGVTPSIDDARGGSALRGTCRFNRVLVSMSEGEAVQAAVDDHRHFFRIGELESNLAPPSADVNRWFEKRSVKIANGESVGVVAPWKWPDAFSGITDEMAARVRDEAGRMPPEQCRENVQADDWFGHVVARICDLTPEPGESEKKRKQKTARIKGLLREWVRTSVLEVRKFPDAKSKRDVPCYQPGSNDPRVIE